MGISGVDSSYYQYLSAFGLRPLETQLPSLWRCPKCFSSAHNEPIMMKPLTKKSIDDATYPKSKGSNAHYIPDGKVERLSLRVYPSGRKAFVLRYYLPGGRGQRQFTIGKFGAWTLAQARETARELLVDIDRGVDPRSRRATPERANRVKEFAEVFLRDHSSHLRSRRDHERRMRRHIVARWGAMPLAELGVDEIHRLKDELQDTPYEANRVLELIGTMFNKAEAWGHLPEGHPNPARKVSPFREPKRKRVLKDDERVRLIEAIDGLRYPHTRVLLRLYLDLPFRKSELMRARWDGADLRSETPTLTVTSLSDHKEVSTQPLQPQHIAMLEGLPRVDGNPHIFPGHSGKGHLKNVQMSWEKARRVAGCEDVRLHDLRRTIATKMASRGAGAHQIQQALGHKDIQTSAAYVHGSAEMNRALLGEIAES